MEKDVKLIQSINPYMQGGRNKGTRRVPQINKRVNSQANYLLIRLSEDVIIVVNVKNNLVLIPALK